MSYNFTALRLNTFGDTHRRRGGQLLRWRVLPGDRVAASAAAAAGAHPHQRPVSGQVRSNADVPADRVRKIVDVGPDPSPGSVRTKCFSTALRRRGGNGSRTATGEREFEVHKTQSFPGMEEPREAPLPGGYQLLASASEPTSVLSTKDVLLILAAAVVAMLVLVAIVSISRAKQDRRHRPPRANRHRGETTLGGSARHGEGAARIPCDVRDAARRRA